MPTASVTPITFPHTFHADPAYRYGSVLFSLVGVIGMGLAASRHDHKSMLVLGLPFLVFFGAILLTNLFEMTIDEAGLHQRSLLGRKDANWDQVRRLDWARTYSVHGADDKELVWLSMLSIVNQQAIADEIILRGGLRPSEAKLDFPLRKQWVR